MKSARTMLATVMATLMVMAACGAEAGAGRAPSSPSTARTTTTAMEPAPSTSTSTLPSEPVPLTVDPTLDVEPADAVVTWWTPSLWRFERTPTGALALSTSLLVGDEDSHSFRVVFEEAADGTPLLLDGTSRRKSWDGQQDVTRSTALTEDHVTLRDWDPLGLVSGIITAPETEPVAFWVDTSLTVIDTAGDPPYELALREGQVATVGCCGYLQLAAIVEDSRCPPEVTCVWEGDLVLEVVVHDESGPLAHELSWTDGPVEIVVSGVAYRLSFVDASFEPPVIVQLSLGT